MLHVSLDCFHKVGNEIVTSLQLDINSAPSLQDLVSLFYQTVIGCYPPDENYNDQPQNYPASHAHLPLLNRLPQWENTVEILPLIGSKKEVFESEDRALKYEVRGSKCEEWITSKVIARSLLT
jgi:hypothetical protein